VLLNDTSGGFDGLSQTVGRVWSGCGEIVVLEIRVWRLWLGHVKGFMPLSYEEGATSAAAGRTEEECDSSREDTDSQSNSGSKL
jgi:hypothetical protein